MSIFDDFNFNNKALLIGVFLCLLILGVISYFAYNKYVSPLFNNKEYIENNEPNRGSNSKVQDVNLMFFYTEWCPHSQRGLEVWKEFKSEHDNKVFNKYQVRMHEVDCDKDEERASEYNITGYPTIKLIKSKDDIIEFDAKPEKKALLEFLNTALH